jgi:F-type H+-transporting ATPase subunit epsilon
MNLRILLPYRVFLEETAVLRIVAEGSQGSFGLLPNRLDCLAALVPGIFAYTASTGRTEYVAVDAGVLVKSGAEVRVSVRRAIGGSSLDALRSAVKREFAAIDSRERGMRAAVAKMEADLIGRSGELRHER